MAIHQECPQSEGGMMLGTALVAVRCKMMDENRCKGDGFTPGSICPYCQGCCEYYRLCELCGELITAKCPELNGP